MAAVALFRATLAPTELPSRIDHALAFEPVENQGDFGTCVAFGAGALFEFSYRKHKRREVRISKRALFSLARHRFAAGDARDDGLYVFQGLRTLEQCYVRRADWPYVHDGDFRKLLDIVPQDVLRRDFVLREYEAVDRSVDAMRSALAERGPIVVAMAWDDDWEDLGTSGVLPPPRLSSGDGHCVVIVGYDDRRRQFRVRNSWGSRWGAAGHFWLPYGFASDYSGHWPKTLYTARAYA